jgi:hypothetical protein
MRYLRYFVFIMKHGTYMDGFAGLVRYFAQQLGSLRRNTQSLKVSSHRYQRSLIEFWPPESPARCEVRQKEKTASEAQNGTTSPAEENPPKGSAFLTMLANK